MRFENLPTPKRQVCHIVPFRLDVCLLDPYRYLGLLYDSEAINFCVELSAEQRDSNKLDVLDGSGVLFSPLKFDGEVSYADVFEIYRADTLLSPSGNLLLCSVR